MTATDRAQQAARDRLAEKSAKFLAAESALEDARTELNAAIADVLMAKTLGPSEVTRLVPYERQHVGRISKAAGVPPLRPRTVVSAKNPPPAES